MVAGLRRLILQCIAPARKWDKPEDEEHAQDLSRGPKNALQLLQALRDDTYSAWVEGGPCGPRMATYMDHAATGRPLKSFDRYLQQHVQPFYANTHTDASEFGMRTNAMMEQARLAIASAVHAPRDDYAVIFTGAGATGALHQLAHTLLNQHHGSHGLTANWKPLVFIGPYEHHSNELLWREQQCDVAVIDEDCKGFVDVAQLAAKLQHERMSSPDRLLISCFSAGSNVTGIATPVDDIATLMHQYGGLACFDYAAAGSYSLPHMTVRAGANPLSYKDAVALSPHKLPGGPGSSGVLVARRSLFSTSTPPRMPGGGTVVWATQYGHAFTDDVEAREEAGTPNILGNIRCGMTMQLFATVSQHAYIHAHEQALTRQLVQGLMAIPGVLVLRSESPASLDWSGRLGIVSFLVQAPAQWACTDTIQVVADSTHSSEDTVCSSPGTTKQLLHHHYVCKLLSDVYGIQARSGCSCAGPYGLSLLMPIYRQLLADKMSGLQGSPCTHTSPCCVRTARYHMDCAPVVDATVQEAHLMGMMAEMGVTKAGWIRLSLKYINTEADIQYALQAIEQIAAHGWQLLPQYQLDAQTGNWQWIESLTTPHMNKPQCPFPYSLNAPAHSAITKQNKQAASCSSAVKLAALRQRYLRDAMQLYGKASEWVAAASEGDSQCWQEQMRSLPEHIEQCQWWMSPNGAASALLAKSPARKLSAKGLAPLAIQISQ